MSTLDEIAAGEDKLASLYAEYRDWKRSDDSLIEHHETDPATPRFPGSKKVVTWTEARIHQDEAKRSEIARAQAELVATKRRWLEGVL